MLIELITHGGSEGERERDRERRLYSHSSQVVPSPGRLDPHWFYSSAWSNPLWISKIPPLSLFVFQLHRLTSVHYFVLWCVLSVKMRRRSMTDSLQV